SVTLPAILPVTPAKTPVERRIKSQMNFFIKPPYNHIKYQKSNIKFSRTSKTPAIIYKKTPVIASVI
ncbi:hypothetical protein KAX35_05635, partial [candidate division WOR-3 bacterium]|nr:hypothetical protein [candidate division WOR-3 bacterium]